MIDLNAGGVSGLGGVTPTQYRRSRPLPGSRPRRRWVPRPGKQLTVLRKVRFWQAHRKELDPTGMQQAAPLLLALKERRLYLPPVPPLLAEAAAGFRCSKTLPFLQLVLLACSRWGWSYLQITHRHLAAILGCSLSTAQRAVYEATGLRAGDLLWRQIVGRFGGQRVDAEAVAEALDVNVKAVRNELRRRLPGGGCLPTAAAAQEDLRQGGDFVEAVAMFAEPEAGRCRCRHRQDAHAEGHGPCACCPCAGYHGLRHEQGGNAYRPGWRLRAAWAHFQELNAGPGFMAADGTAAAMSQGRRRCRRRADAKGPGPCAPPPRDLNGSAVDLAAGAAAITRIVTQEDPAPPKDPRDLSPPTPLTTSGVDRGGSAALDGRSRSAPSAPPPARPTRAAKEAVHQQARRFADSRFGAPPALLAPMDRGRESPPPGLIEAACKDHASGGATPADTPPAALVTPAAGSATAGPTVRGLLHGLSTATVPPRAPFRRPGAAALRDLEARAGLWRALDAEGWPPEQIASAVEQLYAAQQDDGGRAGPVCAPAPLPRSGTAPGPALVAAVLSVIEQAAGLLHHIPGREIGPACEDLARAQAALQRPEPTAFDAAQALRDAVAWLDVAREAAPGCAVARALLVQAQARLDDR